MTIPETIIPAPGRIVHVNNVYDDTIPCRAALVTGIDHNTKQIHLRVFHFRTPDQDCAIAYDSPNWHWPERT